jgi:hypothetical protein
MPEREPINQGRRDFLKFGGAVSLVLIAERFLSSIREASHGVSPEITNKNFETFLHFQKNVLEQIRAQKAVNSEHLSEIDQKIYKLEQKIIDPNLKTRELADLAGQLSESLLVLNSAIEIMAENCRHDLEVLENFLKTNPGLTAEQMDEVRHCQTEIMSENDGMIKNISYRISLINQIGGKIEQKFKTPNLLEA